ncbi:TetR/AcrR family transcriptional regulator [Kineosporia sp. J2-2]|uniref:TetR/AcrR family transcriptional regulator n=1 Tax=Kineosporia corallincola TaxID=2835133 RepID=A0ABS5TT65_9ACTN|nr:TetR/AcrR family transcriptional regulator [Kineosporia corallincola]MBT0774011.1 TetR/AcrR family transcriptional regulator [Kineosporia corallincola]
MGSLSRDAIVQVAMNISREQGLPAVTMRAVAAPFGVTPMALYRHVGDREDLARLVTDRVGALVRPPAGPGTPWAGRVRAWARVQRSVLRDYPGTAAWLIENGPSGPEAYRLLELLAAALADSGLDDARVARGTALVMSWTFSRIAVEDSIALAGRRSPRRGRTQSFVTGLATVDPATHPVATRIGEDFFTLPGEVVFDTGLDWIVAGLTADSPADSPAGQQADQ